MIIDSHQTKPTSNRGVNKTLYIREEDVPTWDKARELTGEKPSSFVVQVLRQFVSERNSKPEGFERIVLNYVDDPMPVAKAFVGRWVIRPDEAFRAELPEPLASSMGAGMVSSRAGFEALMGKTPPPPLCAVAVTPKGNFIAFQFAAAANKRGEFQKASLHVFKSLREAAGTIAGNVVTEAQRRIGVVVHELDV